MTRSDAGKLGGLASREYQAKRKQERREDYLQDPKCCETCKDILPYENRTQKYCSQSCAGYKNSSNRLIANKARYCKACNTRIITTKTNKVYCNLTCHAKSRSIRAAQEFIEITKPIPQYNGHVKGKSAIRTILKEVCKNTCQVCGLNEWMGKPIGLVMDHIDGDSTNNSIDNLRMICNNCDEQTPFYKGRNRGKGRYSRRERYAKGLSY